MTDAVLFDLDGVLVDSYPVWFQVLNTTLEEHGKGRVTEEEFRATWGQSVPADLERWFPKLSQEELEATYARHFLSHTDAVRVMPKAAETLRDIRLRGRPIAVVTNSQREVAEALLASAGLTDFIDTLVTASDVPRPKPEPDMLLEAVERLGKLPGAVTMVGDSKYDRQAAESAGCTFIHFGVEIDALPELIERL